MSEQEGPYKLMWDAGIKRHTLSGPGLEENNNLRCGLRLELEPDLDNFNYVWHSRDAEVAELKAEKEEAVMRGMAVCVDLENLRAEVEALKAELHAYNNSWVNAVRNHELLKLELKTKASRLKTMTDIGSILATEIGLCPNKEAHLSEGVLTKHFPAKKEKP